MTTIEDAAIGELQHQPSEDDLDREDDPGYVTLQLADRAVCFRGSHVASVPDDTDPQRPALELFLTNKGTVAVYDDNRRALAVHELPDFVAKFTNSPNAWIVDSVLAAIPRPVDYLDI